MFTPKKRGSVEKQGKKIAHRIKATFQYPAHFTDVMEGIENMTNNKGKFWRKRGGSSRMSLSSNKSLDSRTLVDVEEEFLHAAEFGDIPTVRKLLEDNQGLNLDCIDALGRTALRLAVKNEHLEIVEILLEKSSSRHIYEAVLQAISAGHVQIAETILKHKRYLELWKERKKLGDDDNFFKTQFEESQFSPDITPLILASQKNQYEIVQILLLRGEKIQNPHKFGCMCRECVNKMKFDQLRSAKYRLNAYRGLSSEAYISLSSKDPILTAFQLSKELKILSKSEKYFKEVNHAKNKFDQLRSAKYRLNAYRGLSSDGYISLSSKDRILTVFQLSKELKILSKLEKYFKLEYKELRNQLSEYVVKLLDRVRNQEELEIVLNKSGKPEDETYSDLARLSLAIQFMEKKFVAHPSCQQRLDKSWFEGIGPFLKAGIIMRVLMILAFIVAYPFLALCYIFLPHNRIRFLKVLKFPWVKFVVHSAAYVIFLILIIVTTTEATYLRTTNATLASSYSSAHKKYEFLKNVTNLHLFGADIPIRQSFPTNTQMLISLWTVGFLYHECCQISTEGFRTYCLSTYNLVDTGLLILYAGSFTLKYLVMLKVHIGISYFNSNSVEDVISNVEDSKYNLYWLTADRFYWDTWDPVHLSEGLFAIANILGFSRISYLLPANEALGPLQISLGRMLKDICKCLCLMSLVLIAFVIGLQNLYWYYNARESIELEKRNFDVPAQTSFGDTLKAFRTVFWSLFGRGEANAVTLGDYNNSVTTDIGYLIYGLYNVVMVTVLINMLIAMMARSFQAIAEESDVEWKFARSQLYMEYISEEEILPVPLNLARIPRSILECIFCCQSKENQADGYDEPPDIYDMGNGKITPPPPMRRNGVEHPPLNHVTQIAAHIRTLTSTSSNNSSIDMSAVDIYEGNRTSHLSRTDSELMKKHRQSITGMLNSNKGYQKVMQRIIQRYIFDIQREAEVTEDDFEEIKQDISSFRYEMLNASKTREQQILDVNVQLSKLTAAVLGNSSPPHDADVSLKSKFQLKTSQMRNLLKKQGSRTSLLNSQSPSEDVEDGYETGGMETDRSEPDLRTSLGDKDYSRSDLNESQGSLYGKFDSRSDLGESQNSLYGKVGSPSDLEASRESISGADMFSDEEGLPQSVSEAGEAVEAAKTSDDEECFVVDNHNAEN